MNLTENSKKALAINQQSKTIENYWRNELANNGVSDVSRKLQANYKAFNKVNFPVVIKNITGVDYFSQKTYSYGEIDFSKAGCGWTDSTIFHLVPEGSKTFAKNEIGKKIGVRYSRGGGSAFYEFDYTPANVKIVVKALLAAGYMVELKAAK